jgi:solute carrier family 25 phosphate transporter 23/24/25/41
MTHFFYSYTCRLQAQGTPAHPYRYTSALDAAKRTLYKDGVKGFYKGLGPTLFKVVPSVSISYAVYEFSKRSLGIS